METDMADKQLFAHRILLKSDNGKIANISVQMIRKIRQSQISIAYM